MEEELDAVLQILRGNYTSIHYRTSAAIGHLLKIIDQKKSEVYAIRNTRLKSVEFAKDINTLSEDIEREYANIAKINAFLAEYTKLQSNEIFASIA